MRLQIFWVQDIYDVNQTIYNVHFIKSKNIYNTYVFLKTFDLSKFYWIQNIYIIHMFTIYHHLPRLNK